MYKWDQIKAEFKQETSKLNIKKYKEKSAITNKMIVAHACVKGVLFAAFAAILDLIFGAGDIRPVFQILLLGGLFGIFDAVLTYFERSRAQKKLKGLKT